MNRSRGTIEMCADILRVLSERSECITQIMYRANVGCQSLSQKYLPILMDHGLVSCNGETRGRRYSITDKGTDFVKHVQGMARLLGVPPDTSFDEFYRR